MVAVFLALALLINEVQPAPASGPEWIELYNPTDEAIDVSGWRLDDDTPGGNQTIITAGSLVPAHGYLVVALSSAILNNTGDSATLLAADGAVVDSVAFGALKSSESYARVPDGGSVWEKGNPTQGTSNLVVLPTPDASVVPSQTASATIEPSATAAPPATVVPADDPTATSVVVDPGTPTPAALTDTVVPASPTHTDAPTRTSSSTKTSSPTRTPSLTKTSSPTRTPSLTKTLSPSRTASRSKTAAATKPARPSRTPKATTTPRALVRTQTSRRARVTQATTPSVRATVTASATAPRNTDVSAAPSPALQVIAAEKTDAAPFSPTALPTTTPEPPAPATVVTAGPPTEWPLIPLGCVLLMLGWIALRAFARVAAPVLYSATDEEADTRAAAAAQRVESGESSTSASTDGTAESTTIKEK